MQATVTATVSLTVKESALFASIAEGMDEPGCGWLHELAESSRSLSAVLGSLVRKGLVDSDRDDNGAPSACYWVSLTEAGQAFSQGRPSPAVSAEPDLAELVGLIEAGLEALGLNATAKQDLAIDLAVLRGQMSRSERLAPVMTATLEAVRQALASAPKFADPAWIARLDDLMRNF